MANLETQARAYSDWLAGVPYKEIASKYQVPSKTIEKWAKKYNWKEEKEKALEKIKNSLAVRFEKKITASAEMFLDIALQTSLICRKGLQGVTDEKIKNMGINDILNLAARAAQVYKLAVPDAPEALVKFMIQDLQKVKQSIKNGDDET
jgi:replicative superfamily II helicase